MLSQPAYQLECRKDESHHGCGWVGKFYFDVPVPSACPRCHHTANLKSLALQIGPGYQRNRWSAEDEIAIPDDPVEVAVEVEPEEIPSDLPF